MNKKYVTWEEVENFVVQTCKFLEERGKKPFGVFGLPRGGLCIATILSYRLDIPLLLAPAKNCLIVDDISDTGETLLHYKNSTYSTYDIATMYYRKGSLVKPDFFTAEKTDEWIVFPWEEIRKSEQTRDEDHDD